MHLPLSSRLRQHFRPLRRMPRMRQGMAIAGMMLVLMALLALTLLGTLNSSGGSRGSGTLSTTGNSLQMSSTRTRSVGAFNMAESGVEYTLQWLNSLAQPPVYVTAFAPAFVWASTAQSASARAVVQPDPSNSANSFSIVIYPDSSNPGNTTKRFLIESVGMAGGQKQIVRAYVQTSSLSKWLVLVNKWAPPNNFWVGGLSSFDGPVHDNNADGQLENVAWYSAANAPPIFTYTGSDAYESSGNGVNWYKDNNFGGTTPPVSGTDWAHIAAGGAGTVSKGAAAVPFPSSSQTQQYAALGLTPPAPNAPVITPVTAPIGLSPVVQVTPQAGVYIHGDVQHMTLSVDGSGNQVIKVEQTDLLSQPYVTTLTLDKNGGSTQVHVDYSLPNGNSGTFRQKSTDTTVGGPSNGVVYCDGNIGTSDSDQTNFAGTAATGGISGVIADNAVDGQGNITHANALTIATPYYGPGNAGNKNVNIEGNLVYKTARQKDASGNYVPESSDSNFTQRAGTLGIVSNTILLTEKDRNGNPLGDIETNGTYLAHNVFEVDHYATRAAHNWEHMGGYLSEVIGVFGQFNGSTGLITNGMNNMFNYDSRLRDTPPPFFPTNGNVYEVLSWQRAPATIQ